MSTSRQVGSPGYSGTRLAQKLGIGEDHVVALVDPPDTLGELLVPLPAGVTFRDGLRGKPDVVMLFARRCAEFQRRLPSAGRAIFPGGAIWICWPKQSSGVVTDMTEDVVRELALPRGLVDNKVCAIDETWSGLRIVWRVEHRKLPDPPGPQR